MKIENSISLIKKSFGLMEDGTHINLYVIKNSNGIEVSFTNYGCRITSLFVPDKAGKYENVVLGYDKLDNYLNDEFYLGSVVGRYANRIARGKFILSGEEFQLPVNMGLNHLHGGVNGFDKVIWSATEVAEQNGRGVKFRYTSKDGEEGYPGELNVEVTYLLTEDNELQIEYKADTNKATPINLSNHAYFNLSGDFSKSILNHHLKINSHKILETDLESIPTGNIINVDSTPFDFRRYGKISKRINANDVQLINGNGYDHCFILEEENNTLKLCAELFEPNSARLMEVYTTEPAIQLYTGNYLNREKTNGRFATRTGLCLETQHYPDSPNYPEFPNTVLNPGKKYHSRTIYKFEVREHE